MKKKTFNTDNLGIILDHFSSDEIKSLEEEMDETLPEDLEDAIAHIEKNEQPHHIAYNLLLLQKELKDNSN